MSHTVKDVYNVDQYTDDELYHLLDLNNPTDRELEAKIWQMVRKYRSIGNQSGDKLAIFFKNIYHHFFDSEEDEEEDDDENDEEHSIDEEHPSSKLREGFNSKPVSTTSSSSIVSLPPSSLPSSAPPSSQPPASNSQPSSSNSTTVVRVNPLDYTKDQLNPLLKQTIRRIISIDSQYRDNKQTLSTNFTFNLSEPLKDVVALRLYSIQVPYTWYTVSNSYGGNFFYLKGITPGIDNGDFDYMVDISSGNYSPDNLVAAINNSLSNLKNTYTDVSFGNSSVSYNSSNARATFNIQLQHVFNESNFQLQFPPPIRYPADIVYTNPTTLQQYLGFNSLNYTPNTVYSIKNVLPFTSITNNSDTQNTIYVVDGSNNYFNIVQYQATTSTDSNGYAYTTAYSASAVVNTIRITLNLSGTYSRNQILAEVNNQLAQSPYLTNSSLTRIDITDASNVNYNYSHFELQLNLNPKRTAVGQNLKTAVLFPTETNTNNRVWVYDPANINIQNCFVFASTLNELSNVVAESTSKDSNFVINSNPYFVLKCSTAGYASTKKWDPSNNPIIYNTQHTYQTDNSYNYYNDYVVVVPNSVNQFGSYSLSQYLTAINTAIRTTNTNSIDRSNTLGVFNTTNTYMYESNTNITNLQIDLNKLFLNNVYYLDLSGTYLNTAIKFNNTRYDLSGMVSVSSTPIDPLQSYIGLLGDMSYNIATFLPKPGFDNSGASPWLVPAVLPNNVNPQLTSPDDFVSTVNYSFQTFADFPNSFPLQGTNMKYIVDQATGKITFTLSTNVQKILTQQDYTLYFYDPKSGNTGWSMDISNTWYNYLKYNDPSYNLNNYLIPNSSISDISGNGSVSSFNCYLTSDSYFTINGITNGVSTSNAITITIPARTTPYTRTEITSLINSQLTANPFSYGSYASVITDPTTNNQYIQLRMNINRIYTANDYRLVFYDINSFVKCYVGVSSVRNVSWDSTIGWILGFRAQTEYDLSNYTNANNVAILTGDSTVTTTLYNYFLVIVDDYTQSHLNDGLVTLTNQENDMPLPSYASRSNYQCDPTTGTLVFNGSNNSPGENNLTQNQVYALNQIYQSQQNKPNSYSQGPFIQDIFGLIPMKTTGLANGSPYIEFGGTLQNQERIYFGPVNIHRLSIKLVDDRGDIVDLNGSNWSFSFICEQLYQQKSI
jgi:hypothetical protein